MFKKILVPLDLTNKHGPALSLAAEFAQQSRGNVVLLHVIEVIPGLSRDEESDFYNRLERSARKHLEQLARTLADDKIPFQIEITYGNRAREIAHYAAETRADLIVLTAPRLEPDNPSGWGSMSYKVGILAHCPVLLVK
jgi:nucleotide-binding universal stress UspA family protein